MSLRSTRAAWHNCIHPVFAESFLDSLDGLPSHDALSDPTLMAEAELVVDGQSGALRGLVVRRTSGVRLFDQAVLATLRAVFPIEPVPAEIASSDGNVYFTWEFHGNRDEACSTYFARPSILLL